MIKLKQHKPKVEVDECKVIITCSNPEIAAMIKMQIDKVFNNRDDVLKLVRTQIK